MSKASKKSYVVIGLGRFGSTVATELARMGSHVLGIDQHSDVVARHADILAEAVIADARDEHALREAGIEKYDVALVAIGESLEASVLCTMHVKLLGIETIWVKAQNKTHHRIITKLGADRVILPEQEMGQHVAQTLYNPLVKDYVSLGNGFNVVHLQIPARLDKQPFSSLHFERSPGVRCLGMMRGTEYIDYNPSTLLAAEDRIIVLGRRPDLRDLSERI